MAWLSWRQAQFYLSINLVLYLFIYCFCVYNGSSSDLTYNPLLSNGGWLMNWAMDRMWRKRSQPIWDIITNFWRKEVRIRKVSVKTANFQVKIWTRNSRMWGLILSILTFGHGTLVGLDDNYYSASCSTDYFEIAKLCARVSCISYCGSEVLFRSTFL
jgi:hypothetical protein